MSTDDNAGFVVEAFDAPPHPHALAGVLFAEEFELAEAPSSATEVEPAPPAAIGDAALMEARERGMAEGRDAAMAELHAGAAIAATAAGTALTHALQAAENAAHAAASAQCASLSNVVLRLLASAFPELCARHGPREAAAFAAAILPMLTQESRVLIRANPHTVKLLGEMLADHLLQAAGRVQLIGTDALEADDMCIEWNDGAARRDMRAFRRTLNNALAPLGIPIDPPSQPTAPILRELAYAE